MNEWINAKDRLPEHTGDTLVVVGINRNGLGMFDEIRVANYNTVFKGWTVYEAQKTLIGEILYWMPIPAMPLEV